MDLLRAATVPATLVVVATLLLMVMLEAEAAAAGAPLTWLAEESVAEAEVTQITTSLVSHVAAMKPAAELKKYDAKSPPRRMRMMVSPPSLLDYAINFSQENSCL
jgi:hypothetical protein